MAHPMVKAREELATLRARVAELKAEGERFRADALAWCSILDADPANLGPKIGELKDENTTLRARVEKLREEHETYVNEVTAKMITLRDRVGELEEQRREYVRDYADVLKKKDEGSEQVMRYNAKWIAEERRAKKAEAEAAALRRERDALPRRGDEDLREGTDAPIFLVQCRWWEPKDMSMMEYDSERETLVDLDGNDITEQEAVDSDWGRWEWRTARVMFTREEAQAWADAKHYNGPYRVYSVPTIGKLRTLLRGQTDYDTPTPSPTDDERDVDGRLLPIDNGPQRCKECGRIQHAIWTVPDDDWTKLPKPWNDGARTLCLECYAEKGGALSRAVFPCESPSPTDEEKAVELAAKMQEFSNKDWMRAQGWEFLVAYEDAPDRYRTAGEHTHLPAWCVPIMRKWRTLSWDGEYGKWCIVHCPDAEVDIDAEFLTTPELIALCEQERSGGRTEEK